MSHELQDVCRIAVIGECLLEFSSRDNDLYKMSFAGDTLNAAVYWARCSNLSTAKIEYITGLGDDPFSERMLKAWEQEGVGHRFVRRFLGMLPGLYMIQTDDEGERQFYYYRTHSPARQMFAGVSGDKLAQQLQSFDYIYFSGITLAILASDQDRDKLLLALEKARMQGAKICFDDNYRPVLWPSLEEAQKWMLRSFESADIALPSFDDERKLFGDRTMQACAKRLRGYGVEEIVVKRGAEGYLLSNPIEEELVCAPVIEHIVDTTAAGDAFNGCYLASRIYGIPARQAAAKAARLAAVVVSHQGAIIDMSYMKKFLDNQMGNGVL